MFEIDRQALVDATAQLVRIPSINPSLVPGAGGEKEIAEAIADRLRQTPGITVELQDAGDGRPNVIASVGSGPGRTLMLNGHIDTVGVAGMDDPFSGRIEGNRLYGRGADDMKAAMAAALVLLETIARADDFPGRLIVTFVVDEEHSSIGTEAICNEIDRWAPDAALILEPTGLNLCIAHKGFVWATITTRGFAAHGSRYEVGVDAIMHMGRVLSALEQYANDLEAREPHALVGPPSLHASLIHGGQELSSYPDTCVLEIERRTIPGESRESVTRELQTMLDTLARKDEQFQATLEIGLSRDPFEIDRQAEIVTTVGRAAEAVRGETPEILGGAGWMDSSLLDKAGVPVVIFGTDGEGAHGLVEWTDLDVLEKFAEILGRVCYDYCGAR